ncbi:MAG TPA: hypothetical protein VLX29_09900 [Nitrospirota bacterium]|nr:hypothetical protein [Nitrospirota bacterium]
MNNEKSIKLAYLRTKLGELEAELMGLQADYNIMASEAELLRANSSGDKNAGQRIERLNEVIDSIKKKMLDIMSLIASMRHQLAEAGKE